MSGSRKGEKRGAARHGGAPKRQPDPQRAVPGFKRVPSKTTENYIHEIMQTVDGVRGRAPLPREMVLEAQGYFWTKAQEAIEYREALLKSLRHPSADDVGVRAQLQNQIAQADIEIRDNYLLAHEMARTAMPYYHARVTGQGGQAGAGNPLDVMTSLLDEIDQATRGAPSWVRPELKLVK